MRHVQSGYRGLGVVVGLNLDRVATAAAVLGGLFLATLLHSI